MPPRNPQDFFKSLAAALAKARKPKVAEPLSWSESGLGNHYTDAEGRSRASHGDYEVSHVRSQHNEGKGHYSVKYFANPINPRSYDVFAYSDSVEGAKSTAEEHHSLTHYGKQLNHGRRHGHDIYHGSPLHSKIKQAFPDQGAKRFIGMHPDQVKHEIARVREAYPDQDDVIKADPPLDHAANELKLHIENSHELSGPGGHKEAIHQNLSRKMKAGKYDHAKAPVLWRYLVDSAHRTYGGPRMPPNARQEVAQHLADEHHPVLLAEKHGISEQDAEHAIRAYGPDVSKRWHGMHPDMVRHEVERAKGSMDKAEYKGKNFRTSGKPAKQGTKYAELAGDALKDVRHNVGSGQVRNPGRAPGEEADYARRASGNKRQAGPGDALFAVGAKKGPTLAGYHDRTIYSYGQHWPVVAHYPQHNLLVVNTHNYGGATKRIVDNVLDQAPKQFPGTNIVRVNHPDYQHTSHIMRGSIGGIHEHVKQMADYHEEQAKTKPDPHLTEAKHFRRSADYLSGILGKGK